MVFKSAFIFLLAVVTVSIQAMEPDLLDRAIFDGDIATVTRLLDQNPTWVNRENEIGRTPLFNAFEYRMFVGCPEIIRLLVSRGADINKQYGQQKRTLLHDAMWKAGSDDFESGNGKVVQLLIELGADVNQQDIDGATPLHVAASIARHTYAHNIMAAAAALLASPVLQINKRNNAGETPLEKAFYQENQRLFRLLLAKGVDVNIPMSNGESLLHRCAIRGDEQAIRLLFDHGASMHREANSCIQPSEIKYRSVAKLLDERYKQEEQEIIAKNAKIAFCGGFHPRLGVNNRALQSLGLDTVKRILHFVRPEHFPAPTLSLEYTMSSVARAILSNRRLQIAAGAIALCGFVVWRFVKH